MQSQTPFDLDDVMKALERPAVQLVRPDLRQAAVAVVLSPSRRMWLMRRAEHPSDPWSGQLSVPGGKREDGDQTLLQTAQRETWEEVGLPLQDAHYLGQLDDLRTRPIRTMVIRPFVFAVDKEPEFRLGYEVQSMHAIELQTLLDGAGRGTMRWPARIGIPLPRVDFDGVRLWGLSLRIVDGLLHRLDGGGIGLERLK